MRFIKIIFICIIIFLLYLLIDHFNTKNYHIKDDKIISTNNKNEKFKIKKNVSFADENNKPLETFIKIYK